MNTRRELLFSTPHGSHLYGMAHADSDSDIYEVLTPVRGARPAWSAQTITDDADTFRVDLPTWLTMCDKGVPQALEAMFSTRATVDRITALRAAWRPTTRVLPTYLRTIRHFVTDERTKRRRHAVRLALNLADLQAYGRFVPTLTAAQVATVTVLEQSVPGEGLIQVCEAIAFGRWKVPHGPVEGATLPPIPR